MRRKVISLAKKTNVVTLPNEWCEDNNIKKGDEVDVFENDDSLVIKSIGTQKCVEVDVSDLGKVLKRVLASVYKAGFDNLLVRYTSEEELSLVEKVIHETFIGFEIISLDENKQIVKARTISELDYSEFDNILRRIFRQILKTGEDIIEKNFNEENIRQRDIEINKYCDYCRRIINKNAMNKINKMYKRNPPLYYICEEIEKIGDEFRDLALSAPDNNFEIISSTINLFKQFYEIFYSFNLISIRNFCNEYEKLKEKLIGKINNNPSSKELLICKTIIDKTYDMNGPLMACTMYSEFD